MGKNKTSSGPVNTNMGYMTLPVGYVLKDGSKILVSTYVTFLQAADGTRTIQTPTLLAGKVL